MMPSRKSKIAILIAIICLVFLFLILPGVENLILRNTYVALRFVTGLTMIAACAFLVVNAGKEYYSALDKCENVDHEGLNLEEQTILFYYFHYGRGKGMQLKLGEKTVMSLQKRGFIYMPNYRRIYLDGSHEYFILTSAGRKCLIAHPEKISLPEGITNNAINGFLATVATKFQKI